MAGKVIDLISSSPQPEPRSRLKTHAAKPSTATRPTPHAAVDLDGLTDEFDTTGDIDGGGPLSQRSPNIRRSALRRTAVPGVEILSDDFQSTGDFAEPILVESMANGNKRRRISPSPKLLSSPHRTSRTKAPATVDDFEFSDPFASSPPPPTAEVVKPRDTWNRNTGTSVSGPSALKTSATSEALSGPFASSPPWRAHPENSSGPLISCIEKSRPDVSTIPQSSDPFKSSQDIIEKLGNGKSGSASDSTNVGAGSKRPVSKTRSCSPIAREASSDPFATSPVRKAPPPAQDVMDLTQHDIEDAPRQHTARSNSRSQPRAPSDMSPDPFATSPPPETKPSSMKAGVEIMSSPPPVVKATSRVQRQNWDPISSSAPEAPVINIDSDSDSANNSEDFPDIDSLVRDASQKPRSSLSRSRSDILPKSKTASKVSKSKQPARTADERARDKVRKESDKEREKERKKEERQKVKEARTREKERAAALAEVNKMKTDKKVSTPEMIVDVPSSLNDGTKVQLDTLLEGLGVEFRAWDTSDVVVKWRRKVTSKWSDDLGHWEPIPKRIMHEKHVAVIITAQEFVDLTIDPDRGIRSHIMSMDEKFAGSEIIYIVEGMLPWMRKNRNLRNRQYTAGVRSETTGGGRRRAPVQEYISEDLVEDALLELQVMHDVLIHHTAIPLETAQWITVLTQHISTIPYKQQKSQAQGAGFCMESGQVKTGEDNKDTYVRMLQEIARVTQPIAYGVAIEFPSVTQLVNGLSDGGPTRLSDTRKTVNREGTLGDRAIGQAVSKRIHKVFTGRDEGSTDV